MTGPVARVLGVRGERLEEGEEEVVAEGEQEDALRTHFLRKILFI